MKIWKTFHCRSLKPEFRHVNMFVKNWKISDFDWIIGWLPTVVIKLFDSIDKRPRKVCFIAKKLIIFFNKFWNEMDLKLRGLGKKININKIRVFRNHNTTAAGNNGFTGNITYPIQILLAGAVFGNCDGLNPYGSLVVHWTYMVVSPMGASSMFSWG